MPFALSIDTDYDVITAADPWSYIAGYRWLICEVYHKQERMCIVDHIFTGQLKKTKENKNRFYAWKIHNVSRIYIQRLTVTLRKDRPTES